MAPSALISAPALLVSDDQVRVERSRDGVIATAPDSIRGKLEVRGIGIMSAPAAPEAQVVLIVDLVSSEDIERFPATTHVASILGIELPVLKLAPFEASAAAKLLLALAQASGHALPP
jgi:serine kinase of HPr protein (carbohydrate metabolism regulator)